MQNKLQCLATDLDGTFVGDRDALEKLIKYFSNLPERIFLVYITGRHLASALELIKDENLPLPDVLATDIGTAIYTFTHNKPIADESWNTQMSKDWYPKRIVELANNFPNLERQQLPDERRVSFYTESLTSVRQFEQTLVAANISHNLIYSSNRDLDILPERSGKANVLNYITEHYPIDKERLLAAGDSGNDFDMLNIGYRSVIVGNGLEDLSTLKERPTLYRAKAHCAGGILEAWQYFFSKSKKVPTTK